MERIARTLLAHPPLDGAEGSGDGLLSGRHFAPFSLRILNAPPTFILDRSRALWGVVSRRVYIGVS